MEPRTNVIHLIAGGAAGTTGAVLTCPLEVVKTRLQSSVTSFVQSNVNAALRLIPQTQPVVTISGIHDCQVTVNSHSLLDRRKTQAQNSQKLVQILRHIIRTEGIRGLFKGLGPTLVGVAPSRAIYFAAYAQSKEVLNDIITPNTHFVHLCSAAAAGTSAVTLTNPVWFVKTRLQLDSKVEQQRLTCTQCVKNIYQQHGLRGFYKGMTASYYGISETVIHLVIYEAIKAKLQTPTNHDRNNNNTNHLLSNSNNNNNNNTNSNNNNDNNCNGNGKTGDDNRKFVTSDYLKYMLAGACSKTFATCLCYPHEVARTRLREEGTRYRSFFQTLLLVLKEEGRAGVYRGLGTQLIRQIPNTAIVMATYEAVVYMLTPEH